MQIFKQRYVARPEIEHGGSLLLGRRKSERPLHVEKTLHVVLRSDFAYGNRSLLKHRPLIDAILARSMKKFGIKVHQKAINTNHVHLLIEGENRESIQNFFRVFAGHVAQMILRQFPLSEKERYRRDMTPRHRRNPENKFWETRLYTRVVEWGTDFVGVVAYILKNVLEAAGLIPYFRSSKSNTS